MKKISLPKKIDFSFRNVSGVAILHIASRTSKILVWIVFLSTLTWLGHFWYSALYDYSWSDAQKNQYRNEYAGQTSFRAKRFNHVGSLLEERIRLHQTAPVVKRDIFTGTSF